MRIERDVQKENVHARLSQKAEVAALEPGSNEALKLFERYAP